MAPIRDSVLKDSSGVRHLKDPTVTVVVATYNRPDTLRVAIGSVVRQTVQDWKLLVIGDACDERTASAMRDFSDDPRVCYVNLDRRCGGQALPNSAGMRLAQSEYVALLNHDDIWLQDHLEVALERLDAAGADLFVGRAAFAVELQQSMAGGLRPHFVGTSPSHRTLREAFGKSYMLFEPASSWVIQRELAERVGAWRSATELYRLSIQDWLLRAWRAGAVLAESQRITCLKLESDWGGSAHVRLYDAPADGHEWVAAMLDIGGPDEVRALLADDVEHSSVEQRWFLDKSLIAGRGMRRALDMALQIPFLADLYRRTGIDAYSLLCRALGVSKGRLWRMVLARRTGEQIAELPTLEEVVTFVEASLARDPNWRSQRG